MCCDRYRMELKPIRDSPASSTAAGCGVRPQRKRGIGKVVTKHLVSAPYRTLYCGTVLPAGSVPAILLA